MYKRLILSAALYVDFTAARIRSLPAFDRRSVEIALSLRKDFVLYKFIGAKVFTITPAFNVYFATDNLAFVRQRTAAEQKHGALGQYTTAIDNFFGFVDMEPSLTVDWRIRNFDISVTPVLAIPFNQFDYTSNTRVENPKQYRFYVHAGVKYLFNVKPLRKKGRMAK